MKDNWDTWADDRECSVCGDTCVPPFGKANSDILLVGEFPGEDEIKTGRPFTGQTGGILRMELRRVGIDIKSVRLCNVWQHTPTKNDKCFELGVQVVVKEAKKRKAILLIGSDTVSYFTGKKVMEVTGLRVDSPLLSAPIIVACVQPTIVFHKNIGELRLSLQKFGKILEDEGIL